MSQLIQKIKFITVQDFLPKWTKFAEEHHSIMMYHQTQDQFGLEISSFDSCLVGEGHGFTSDYSDDFHDDCCKFCYKFASGDLLINGIGFTNAISNLKNFYLFKEGLYNHFMRFHKEKLQVNEELKIE